MDNGSPLEVKVWGEFACFTRPEFGVERVSYEVMTPSAARGVLEAIFWKPEFRWLVREIEVLPSARRNFAGKPVEDEEDRIRHFSILRNEMNHLQNLQRAQSGEPYYADSGDDMYGKNRAQRHTLCLRDAAYVIRADMEMKPHSTDNPAKYRDQFRRRVKRGQCFSQPYLGTREFSAFFGPPDGDEKPVDMTDDLGLMLFDVDFEPDANGNVSHAGHGPEGRTIVKANARPKFFQARLEGGILKVPREMYGRSPT